ncbi:TPA: ATP-binding protein [Raoultella ornithinolytica]|uniref:ATP-binding protein n=1 Tax=Klebsiella variicola TaxID=244366 RepID=UPI00295947D5|nr:ATP-binding protein [Raoultella ornithinolytica]
MKLYISNVEQKDVLKVKNAPLFFSGPISILTGVNGSGKTRFLKALASGGENLKITIDDEVISSGNIVLMSLSNNQSDSLYNNFISVREHKKNSSDNYWNQHSDVSHFYDFYQELCKTSDVVKEIDRMKIAGDYGFALFQSKVTHDECISIFTNIANSVGKDINKLSRNDFLFFFRMKDKSLFSLRNVAIEFYFYLNVLNEILYNEWLRKEHGVEIEHVSLGSFKMVYNEEPWVVFDRILNSSFDGKFSLKHPESIRDENYIPEIKLNENGCILSSDEFSSGERIILYFATAIFSCIYKARRSSMSDIKLLLLDEPDIHLHPKLIKRLYTLLSEIQKTFQCVIMITTHSPTTVALSPGDNVYLIEKNKIDKISKHNAVNALMDGVSSIQFNVENRRQVLVESSYDNEVYQEIFNFLTRKNLLESEIYLDFVSSGPKMDPQLIRSKLAQHVSKELPTEVVDSFIESVNGVGACSFVYSQVGSFHSKGNNNIRGLVDWDNKNKDEKGVVVFAPKVSYTIENIILDPIALKILLHSIDDITYPFVDGNGENTDLNTWLKNDKILQNEVDMFIFNILNRDNKKDVEILYMNGKSLMSDSEYLNDSGHKWNDVIYDKYKCLRRLINNNPEKLKYRLVKTSMIDSTNGDFLPIYFKCAFEKIVSLG